MKKLLGTVFAWGIGLARAVFVEQELLSIVPGTAWPPDAAEEKTSAIGASAVASSGTVLGRVREASLYAKEILEDPVNRERLEEMAKTIRFTAPLKHQKPLLMSAIHRILGTRLEKFGIDEENLGVVFAELHALGSTNPDINRWIESIANLVQNDSEDGSSLYGAAALSLTRFEAGQALDEFLHILRTPENSQKIRNEVLEAAISADPAKYMFHVLEEVVGDKLAKYNINQSNLLRMFAHLRSWALNDSLLRPKFEKVMVALGGTIPQREDKRKKTPSWKLPRPEIQSLLALRSSLSETLPTAHAKLAINDALGAFAKRANKKKLQEVIVGVGPTDLRAFATRVLPTSQEILAQTLDRYGLDKEEVAHMSSYFAAAATTDPNVLQQLVSLIQRSSSLPDRSFE
jgi:hypothetical protein